MKKKKTTVSPKISKEKRLVFDEPPQKVLKQKQELIEPDSTMLMEQAFEVSKLAAEAKKTKIFRLAKAHFANSAEIMIKAIKAEPQNPLASEWKNELRATIAQAEECNNMFKELLELEKKDKYSLEILNNILEDAPKLIKIRKAGLQEAKSALQESLIYPSLRPDLFTGLRAPPKGILLYGPPGNGKTMLAKATAAECKSCFINISASNLVSKFVGDSEKMMRALFRIAQLYQPAVIFIDEIDSILTARSEDESESSRRLKTEFLVQTDGIVASSSERVTIIAATNRPSELDSAALRRFPKRILIGMPDALVRLKLLQNLLKNEPNDIDEKDLVKIAKFLDGYSAADITILVKEAAMEAIRELKGNQDFLINASKRMLRPINRKDFEKAVLIVLPSLDQKTLQYFKDWEAAVKK